MNQSHEFHTKIKRYKITCIHNMSIHKKFKTNACHLFSNGSANNILVCLFRYKENCSKKLTNMNLCEYTKVYCIILLFFCRLEIFQNKNKELKKSDRANLYCLGAVSSSG